MKIRRKLQLAETNGCCFKPSASYLLIQAERRQFRRLLKLVRFLDGFAENLTRNVIEEQWKIYGLKLHKCHMLLQRIF